MDEWSQEMSCFLAKDSHYLNQVYYISLQGAKPSKATLEGF